VEFSTLRRPNRSHGDAESLTYLRSMRLRDDLTRLRQQILAAARANGAERVRVFGSVARGEETPESDVDFLVTLRPGATLLDLTRLELELEALLWPTSRCSHGRQPSGDDPCDRAASGGECLKVVRRRSAGRGSADSTHLLQRLAPDGRTPRSRMRCRWLLALNTPRPWPLHADFLSDIMIHGPET
jgi:predicted nucleotidyltransferase